MGAEPDLPSRVRDTDIAQFDPRVEVGIPCCDSFTNTATPAFAGRCKFDTFEGFREFVEREAAAPAP